MPRPLSDLPRYSAEHPASPVLDRLRDARLLPGMICAAAVLLGAAAVALDWASVPQAVAFAVALALAAALGAFDRRRAEAVLSAEIARRREAEQEARTANRAKSDFLANMSHELRTPLSTVIGTADLLLAADLPPAERRHLEAVDTAAAVLLALIDDVLDFAKLEAGRLRLEEIDFSLRQLAGGVRDLLAPRAAEKDLDLELAIDPSVPDALRGDPARLRQVLLNLAGNAVKFTAEGRVEISIERDDDGGSDAAHRLRFTVRDTGIGISPADQRRIFETFFQADSSAARHSGGSGLGLAISDELVRRMGGEIGLDSERGTGSTFWFRLSLARALDEIPEEVADEAPSATGVDRGRFRVLVVDDHATNRGLALSHLELLGYSPDAVATGEAALARIAEAAAGGELFDAVLMDCQMPGLDGYETTRRLRRQEAERGDARTPVVALTAHAMAGEREKCLAVGMDDYLVKPYRGSELAAVLGRWLGSAAVGGETAVAEAAESLRPPPAGGSLEDEGALFDERIAALRRLGERTGEDTLGQAIADYLHESRRLVAHMRQAQDAGDAAALGRAAHKLIGSSATLGARRLVSRLREIETRALSGEIEDLDELLQNVADEYQRFSEVLQKLFSQ